MKPNRHAPTPSGIQTSLFNLVVGLATLVIVLFLPPYGFVFFLYCAVIVGYLEMTHLSAGASRQPYLVTGLLLLSLIYLISAIPRASDFTIIQPTTVVIISSALIIVLARALRDDQADRAIASAAETFLLVIYLGLFSSFLVKIRFLTNGHLHLSLLIIATWSRDSGAYFLGPRLGSRLIISPLANTKKSVEGAIGAWLFCLVATWLAARLLAPQASLPYLLCISLLAGILGQMGDLVESLFKRAAGSKGVLTTLPLAQGVMDKLDSPLLVAPGAYWFLTYTPHILSAL